MPVPHPIFGQPIHERHSSRLQNITDPAILLAIHTWEHNRPPDPERVNTIAEYFADDGVCDGEILVAQRTSDLVCYDGAHRLAAAKISFPKEGVLVRIQELLTDAEIAEEFRRVNLAMPVPALQFSDDAVDAHLRTTVLAVVQRIVTHQPSFAKPSNRPRRPNFARDGLVDALCEHCKTHLTPEIIMELTPASLEAALDNSNTNIHDIQAKNELPYSTWRVRNAKIWEKCIAGQLQIMIDLPMALRCMAAYLSVQ